MLHLRQEQLKRQRNRQTTDLPRPSGRWIGVSTLTLALVLVVAAVAGVARGASSIRQSGVLAAAAPTPATAPVIIGTAKTGSALAASEGTWTGSPTSFTYQWQRCGPGCASIGGATGRTYAITTGDVGKTIKVTVTASNADGFTSAGSAQTAAVAAAVVGSPTNRKLPVVSGTTRQGHTLTASSGTWAGHGKETFAYQWLRCDSSGGSCSNVGAGGMTYGVTAADMGFTMRVTVTATNPSGSNSAVSVQTGLVTAAQAPANTKKPAISGTPRDNETATATPGKWSGDKPIKFSYQWQRCDAKGINCAAMVPARTNQRYEVRSSDVGHTLRVLVTATNSAGSATALSDPVTAKKAKTVKKTQPSNTSRPTVSGHPVVGQVLNAARGSWAGTTPIDYSYSWQRCNANGDNCSTIGGANGSAYTLIAADVGYTIRVNVVARNSQGSASRTSSATPVIRATAPASTALPVIGGTARQGSTLVATAGAWSSTAALTFYYQWARCDSAGQNCVPISGATRPTYVLTAADVGHRLIVQVKAQSSQGAGYANSAPTALVSAAPAATPSSVDVRSVSLPDRLIIDGVQFTPSRVHSRSEPLIARIHIRETAGGKSVRGAYVYAVGVPFDRLSGAGEVKTDANGWATVTFRILPTFTLRPGNLVVVFVRARKPGGNPLAGISTRRLVSVRVG